MTSARGFPQLAATQCSLLARDRGHEVRDRLCVRALQQVRRHAVLTGSADLDRAQDAGRCDLPDLVEVRPSDATCIDRVEVVTSRTTLDEKAPAPLYVCRLVAHLLLLEVGRVTRAGASRSDHDCRNGDTDSDVEQHD